MNSQNLIIQRMNSNGCVQAWIDIRCVEKSLKPYMNGNSDNYMNEAVRPLLELEKEKDVLLVQVLCFSVSCHMDSSIIDCSNQWDFVNK